MNGKLTREEIVVCIVLDGGMWASVAIGQLVGFFLFLNHERNNGKAD